MIEAMKAKQTLKAAELQNGDIICFQAANDSGKEARASDVVQEYSSPSRLYSLRLTLSGAKL